MVTQVIVVGGLTALILILALMLPSCTGRPVREASVVSIRSDPPIALIVCVG